MTRDSNNDDKELRLGPSVEQRAIDGMLRELARGGDADDEAFVSRVMTALRQAGAGRAAAARPSLGSDATPTAESPRPAASRRAGRRPTAWRVVLPVAAGFAALLWVAAALFQFRGVGTGTGAVVQREMAYQKVGVEKLGMYLAEKHPGGKAVILIEPSGDRNQARTQALLAGLRDGLGSGVTIVKEYQLTIPEEVKAAFTPGGGGPGGPGPGGPGGGPGAPGGPEMMPPMEYWFTAEVFDNIVAEYKDQCNLVITTVGLPRDLQAMNYWNLEGAPKIAVASGSIYELKNVIQGGYVVAAVCYSPKAVYDEKPPPSNLDEAFDKRFLLVTPENVSRLAQTHSDLFMK